MRIKAAIAALGVLSAIGLAACEEEAEVNLGETEIEIEEDGDINIQE